MYPSGALPRWRSSVRSPRSKSTSLTVPKKWVPILALFTVGFLVWVFQNISVSWKRQSYHGDPVNVVSRDSMGATAIKETTKEPRRYNKKEHKVASTKFKATPLKPVGEPYTKMLVIPRTLSEDVSWVEENFGGDPHTSYSIYTADDPTSPLHPPKNKGHEVMIYLSYIIENYNNLSDVNIFMHSHRTAWHNNEILEHDAVQMIARLSSERVQREGYMNMRCQWEPGCPSWMHPGNLEEDMNKQEEALVGKSWSELFPFDPVPEVLAQPCCAQFALSRGRIQAIPISRYVFYRDWLLRTQLSDYISGRVWEYIWQFVFTGHNIVCPQEHVCLCDGFGVCFGGQPEYENYLEISNAKKDLEDELEIWTKHKEQYTDLVEAGKFREAEALGTPAQDKDVELSGKMDELQRWLDSRRNEAMGHGDVAMNRAKEAGRRWSDGDGF